MKTKLIAKTRSAESLVFIASNSVKAICTLLLVLLSLTPNITRAQVITGTLTGTGMGVCSSFSFNSTDVSPTIKPLNYGSQFYACTSATDNDISFNPQGNSWRVQWLSWTFIPGTSSGATLDGFDPSGSAIPQVSIGFGQVLKPVSYVTIGLVDCVKFKINNGPTLGPYNRTNWVITAP